MLKSQFFSKSNIIRVIINDARKEVDCVTFLGILLILLGLGLIIGGFFLVGLIVITVGVICISASSKRKAEYERAAEERARAKAEKCRAESETRKMQENEERAKRKAATKELWIAKRTQELMDSGMLPSDAKVKAETEYTIENAE